MPPQKRPRKISDIVSLLDVLQSNVPGQDYDEICRLLSIYDRAESKTTQEQKRLMTKGLLYTKTCYLIFTELCNVSLASHRLLLVLQRIDEVVEASRTIPNQALLSEAIVLIKRNIQQKREIQHEKIVQECSQLQVSIRIKTMSKIVHLNTPMGDDGRDRCSLLEYVIPEYALQSRTYASLKNYCLLGAVIAHTDTVRNQIATCLSCIKFPVYGKVIQSCTDLERAEIAIYEMIEKTTKAKTVRRHNNKLRKQAIKQLQDELVVLENEATCARKKLHDAKNAIQTRQLHDEPSACEPNLV